MFFVELTVLYLKVIARTLGFFLKYISNKKKNFVKLNIFLIVSLRKFSDLKFI